MSRKNKNHAFSFKKINFSKSFQHSRIIYFKRVLIKRTTTATKMKAGTKVEKRKLEVRENENENENETKDKPTTSNGNGNGNGHFINSINSNLNDEYELDTSDEEVPKRRNLVDA
jgi:hypothetical protein